MEGAEACGGVGAGVLFQGEGFKEGAVGEAVWWEAGESGGEVDGVALPSGGEGRSGELGVYGGIEAGGVHAGDSAEEATVEGLGGGGGSGGSRGKGPYFRAVGEDRGDEGVE